jgi:hypothetical protein
MSDRKPIAGASQHPPRDRVFVALPQHRECDPNLWRDFHRAPKWQRNLGWALVFAAAAVVGLALASLLLHAATLANDDVLNGAARAAERGWM